MKMKMKMKRKITIILTALTLQQLLQPAVKTPQPIQVMGQM